MNSQTINSKGGGVLFFSQQFFFFNFKTVSEIYLLKECTLNSVNIFLMFTENINFAAFKVHRRHDIWWVYPPPLSIWIIYNPYINSCKCLIIFFSTAMLNMWWDCKIIQLQRGLMINIRKWRGFFFSGSV